MSTPSKPLSPAPRTQEPEAGSVTNNQSQVKKAKHQRIDAFELWYWRRLLRVPWTARRSNQSILKEISPGVSLEGMMLKLKLQYFGHLMRRVDSLEKTLILGGIGAVGEGDDSGLWRWRGPSGLRWVWRNGRGANLEWRQEPQRSSRDFTGAGLIRIA